MRKEIFSKTKLSKQMGNITEVTTTKKGALKHNVTAENQIRKAPMSRRTYVIKLFPFVTDTKLK